MEEVNKLGKILIVDDKSVNRYILSGIFENEYDIQECADGSEAIEALEQGREDTAAVLLDIVYAHMRWFAVLKYM